ncbi:MAG: type II toxin-antitoxin system VapC family toxin [Egibacteraceae bacterium]
MIAATAQALGWSVWTCNAQDFARIPSTDIFAAP